jgi:hypothetical protein
VARTILSLGRPQIDRALVTDIETSAFAAAARPR